MATIQRRNGRGGTRYRVQVRLKDHARSATFATRSEAREWGLRVEREIQRQASTDAMGITLGALLQRYQREILPRKKQRTQVNQALHLAWWTQTLGSRALADVTPARLAICRDELARKRRAGTVNQYLRTLSHALGVAVREWGWLEANPLRRVQSLTEPRGRVRFLSDAERVRLLTACEASDNRILYPVVMLALATGARKMELLGLTWPQLDLGPPVANGQ